MKSHLCVYNRLMMIRGRTARTSGTEAATIRRYLDSRFTKFQMKQKEQKDTGSELVLSLCTLQPVILKELKQMDGDFSEDQRIELNTVRHTSVGLKTMRASLL